MSGFYLMHRGWQENPVFGREPFSRRDAWVWLIENAVFRDTKIGVAHKTVSLKRGQLCHSLRHMAKEWGWDDAKVRRFLSRAEVEKMIECVVDAGQTVITICNYDAYQVVERVADAGPDAATTQQRRSGDAIINEDNEVTELPSGSSSSAGAPPLPTVDPKAVIFGPIREWLTAATGRTEPNVRSWLGKCCGTYGDGNVIVVAAKIRAGPEPNDPFSAIVAELKRTAGHNGKSSKPSASDKSRNLVEGMAGALMAFGVDCGIPGASPGRTDLGGDFGNGIIIDAGRPEDLGGYAGPNA